MLYNISSLFYHHVLAALQQKPPDFHIYSLAIQSPPAARRTSQQVNQIMLLPAWNSLKASYSSQHSYHSIWFQPTSGSRPHLTAHSLPHKGTCLFLNPASLCLILLMSTKLFEFIPPHSLLPWPGPPWLSALKNKTLLGGASFNIPSLNSIFAFFIVHMPVNNYFTFFWSTFPPRL